jgi:hypothetical protein
MESQHPNKTSSVKRLAAVIGGSGIVALAAVAIAIGQQQSGGNTHDNAKTDNEVGATYDYSQSHGHMKVGVTYTQTTPSTEAEKGLRATPQMKGQAPLPSEEAAAK